MFNEPHYLRLLRPDENFILNSRQQTLFFQHEFCLAGGWAANQSESRFSNLVVYYGCQHHICSVIQAFVQHSIHTTNDEKHITAQNLLHLALLNWEGVHFMLRSGVYFIDTSIHHMRNATSWVVFWFRFVAVLMVNVTSPALQYLYYCASATYVILMLYDKSTAKRNPYAYIWGVLILILLNTAQCIHVIPPKLNCHVFKFDWHSTYM